MPICMPEGESISGYSIDMCKCEDFNAEEGYCTIPLSEEASGINIETSPCDTGAGSSFCENWSISVSGEAETGCYFIFILPLGETTAIIPGGLQIDVATATTGDTTPPEWTAGEVIVTANTDPGMLYVEWGTAIDADSPPVTYLVYLDTDNSPWDGTVVEKGADDHWHMFADLTAGYWWVGVCARDNASPPNIDQNNDVWGLAVQAVP